MKNNLNKIAKVMAIFVFAMAMFLNIQSNLAGELSMRNAFGTEGSGTGGTGAGTTAKDNKKKCQQDGCSITLGSGPTAITYEGTYSHCVNAERDIVLRRCAIDPAILVLDRLKVQMGLLFIS